MSGGEKWRTAIEGQIAQSAFFVACLTQQSVSKRGVVREEIDIALAVTEARSREDIFIIPVRLEVCALPQQLCRFNCIDMFDVSTLPRLLASIHQGLRRRGITILRSEPDEYLLDDDAFTLRRSLVDEIRRGGRHQFSLYESLSAKILEDHSTGLTWQYGLSSRLI